MAAWLDSWYSPARRKPRGVGGDDIAVAGPLSFECKDSPGRVTLAAWIQQAEANARDRLPIVVAKRKGVTTPERAYVVMTGATFRLLVNMIRERESNG